MMKSQALIMGTVSEVKKGNKDQQEIKTKLTNLRQMTERSKKLNESVMKSIMKSPMLWLGDKKSIPEGWEIVTEWLPTEKGKLPKLNVGTHSHSPVHKHTK